MAVLPQFQGGAAFTGMQQDFGAPKLQRGMDGTGNPGGAYNTSFQHPARAAYNNQQANRLQSRMDARQAAMRPPVPQKPLPQLGNAGGNVPQGGYQGILPNFKPFGPAPSPDVQFGQAMQQSLQDILSPEEIASLQSQVIRLGDPQMGDMRMESAKPAVLPQFAKPGAGYTRPPAQKDYYPYWNRR